MMTAGMAQAVDPSHPGGLLMNSLRKEFMGPDLGSKSMPHTCAAATREVM